MPCICNFPAKILVGVSTVSGLVFAIFVIARRASSSDDDDTSDATFIVEGVKSFNLTAPSAGSCGWSLYIESDGQWQGGGRVSEARMTRLAGFFGGRRLATCADIALEIRGPSGSVAYNASSDPVVNKVGFVSKCDVEETDAMLKHYPPLSHLGEFFLEVDDGTQTKQVGAYQVSSGASLYVLDYCQRFQGSNSEGGGGGEILLGLFGMCLCCSSLWTGVAACCCACGCCSLNKKDVVTPVGESVGAPQLVQ
jgi:hypothetical protein